MANILKAMWDGVADSVESPWEVVKSVGKGDFSGAWDNLKAIPGNQERANSEILNAAGIRGWVGDHPGETAAGIAGSIIAAPIIGGAMGGGGGAPVVEAVGMSPTEAVLAGGGNAAEVGSVSTAGAFSRFGNVLSSMGPKLMQEGSTTAPQAPAFKPRFTPVQTQNFGGDVLSQLGQDNYNI